MQNVINEQKKKEQCLRDKIIKNQNYLKRKNQEPSELSNEEDDVKPMLNNRKKRKICSENLINLDQEDLSIQKALLSGFSVEDIIFGKHKDETIDESLYFNIDNETIDEYESMMDHSIDPFINSAKEIMIRKELNEKLQLLNQGI